MCSEHVCKAALARSRNAVIIPTLLCGHHTQVPPLSGRQCTTACRKHEPFWTYKGRGLAPALRAEAAVC